MSHYATPADYYAALDAVVEQIGAALPETAQFLGSQYETGGHVAVANWAVWDAEVAAQPGTHGVLLGVILSDRLSDCEFQVLPLGGYVPTADVADLLPLVAAYEDDAARRDALPTRTVSTVRTGDTVTLTDGDSTRTVHVSDWPPASAAAHTQAIRAALPGMSYELAEVTDRDGRTVWDWTVSAD